MTHWFAENEIRPIAMKADQMEKVPDDWLEKVNQMGIHLNTSSFGGRGKAVDSRNKGERDCDRLGLLASEELASGDAAWTLSLPGGCLGGPPVQSSVTPVQEERFLSIFTPEKPRWGAYALTEPEAGT